MFLFKVGGQSEYLEDCTVYNVQYSVSIPTEGGRTDRVSEYLEDCTE